MTSRNINQLSFLENSFLDLMRLKEFAKKIKPPPDIISHQIGADKKNVRPTKETHKISSFNLQCKDNEICEHPTHSTSDILKFIERLSPLDYTNGNIQRISKQFQITETHMRNLINSVHRNKYGV